MTGKTPPEQEPEQETGSLLPKGEADSLLDARGLACPLPVLKARKRLMGMAPGALLEVAATDPVAIIDLPHFCAEAGHEFLGKKSDGPVTYYLIRRGAQT
ncbi:sulfurtransferase TusA family protein [Tepidicaulis sp. LMO-SS28]|uniref:sulfurtransferase TusA family protein n=1 Tax=Tepidicaulis sp. LMO-SS28 TaxID=3447455 RepID=UPI003EDFC65D